MFVEAVMGAGGAMVPPKGYFQAITPMLDKYGIFLVDDEVICGFGRTGNAFGCQTYSFQPDSMSIAKALSSAYLPISAVLLNEQVFQGLVKESEKIGTFAHGYTYSAHPVAAAVAIETLKIYEERNILEHVRRVAPRLQNGLRKFADHPLVGEVRGVGLIAGIELVKDKATKESFDVKLGVGPYLVKQCQARGLILRAMAGDHIGFCPPLIVNEGEIDAILERFGKALDDTLAWVRQNGHAKAA